MTIVIKTQSGNLVFNPKNIYIDGNDTAFKLTNIPGDDSADILGSYKTEQRAKEIINKIYKDLDFIGSCKEYVGCPIFVCEMPKE